MACLQGLDFKEFDRQHAICNYPQCHLLWMGTVLVWKPRHRCYSGQTKSRKTLGIRACCLGTDRESNRFREGRQVFGVSQSFRSLEVGECLELVQGGWEVSLCVWAVLGSRVMLCKQGNSDITALLPCRHIWAWSHP